MLTVVASLYNLLNCERNDDTFILIVIWNIVFVVFLNVIAYWQQKISPNTNRVFNIISFIEKKNKVK